MTLSFRTKTFFAIFGVAAAALLFLAVAASVSARREAYDQLEASIVAETRLIAAVLETQGETATEAMLDGEADRLGRELGRRVTFIAADGRVLGDSSVDPPALQELDNHAERPEVRQARATGLGVSRRHSDTVDADMLYTAVPARHPTVAVVRLAYPLTAVDRQLASIRSAALGALGLALVAALVMAWGSSYLLVRRLHAMAAAAERYASGDLSGPVRDPQHDELGVVASVLDDTVRALATRARELDEDRTRMQAILGGMQEGVLMVNAQGRVQLLNQAARQMLRLDESAIGRHYVESIRHPEVAALVGACLQGERRPGLELSPTRNPERTLVARAAPVTGPAAAGAVLVLHDITDLRRADQVRRDFVANVSHELRTPLTAIRGYVEALRDDVYDAGQAQHVLEVVSRHTERMERLVRDLLRLARLEARQEPVEAHPCSMADIVAGAVNDLAAPIERKGQRVETSVDTGADAVVTDAGKLQDALRNIVENAVAYAPPGSTIRIEAALRDDRVLLTVSDRGPGIPEADLTRIFERFYRVDKARSRESGGTGLGLSIVKHLVERLSGEVSAANREGGGAVFTISIPREPAVVQRT